jgi:hypothetical protein
MTTPVFVMGVAPRCGTNYLEDLLCVHPDCGLGIPLRENQLLGTLPDLSAIVRDLRAAWQRNDRWGFLPEHSDDLAHILGAALADFTVSQVDERRRIKSPPATLPGIEQSFKESPRYLISKYPRTTGLPDFRQFFPEANLILLMRDGRAVTESSIRSWGWHFDVAVDNWRRGAINMARFLDQHPDDPALFVRYEDLITQPQSELARIFEYLDLDPATFDYERALGRPVRGSSTVRPVGAGESVAWQPVEKTEDFDPLARARDWTDAQHDRFNHMVGGLSERFGYPLKETDQGVAGPVRHLVLDSLLTARVVTKPIRRRLTRIGRG